MKFLLELASEEIPARMQSAAAEQLRNRFVDVCKAAGLAHGNVTADVTPRRLWLIAEDVAPASAAMREDRKGPAATAPAAAIAGFLRSTGQTRDSLEARETPKGVVLFAHIETPGRDASAILAELVPAIVASLQWPKSMRWGAGSALPGSPRWVRPLTGIVALLGNDVVACEAFGITAGRVTRGHRIHAPGPVEIADADSYVSQLHDAHVIAASADRRALIEAGAAEVASSRGLTVIADAGLVAENAGLTEWPVPMLGHFDPAFLAVPREIIQLTMRTNQKYFALTDASGALAPAFVCVANLVARDGGAAIVAGNERVLSARLADAKFFWDQDLRAGLESFVPKLSQIVFHGKLYDFQRKVNRVANIAAYQLMQRLGWSEAEAQAMQPRLFLAANLAKADLASSSVGEFPELQGTIGGYLASNEGLDVANAIRDQYKPLGPGDSLPETKLGVVLALADKADTLYSLFAIGEKPTGSRDPFALRRAALGIIRLIIEKNLRISLTSLYNAVDFESLIDSDGVEYANPSQSLVEFTFERFKVQQRDAGMRNDLIDAVSASNGEDDLVRLLALVDALQSFLATDDGMNLLRGVKRAANILRIEEAKGEVFAPQSVAALFAEPAESVLVTALDDAIPAIAAAVATEDFTTAMTALASLRPAIDAFFDTVIVNAPDPLLRANRLGLLARVRAAANNVADFSRIEG